MTGLKIISIGNSFSEDAHAYLYAMARRDGLALRTVNLYIGGCNLQTHAQNAADDSPQYIRSVNGEPINDYETAPRVSIRDELAADDWDIVTIQQASHDSGLPDTYFPYAARLSAYIKKYAPRARQWLHQTWAYETDSAHPMFDRYARDQHAMYAALKNAYFYALCRLQMPMIPCGDVIQALRAAPLFDYAQGGPSLCRDGFHLSLDYGRYAAAATWYAALVPQGNWQANDFLPPGGADPARIALIKEVVWKTVSCR